MDTMGNGQHEYGTAYKMLVFLKPKRMRPTGRSKLGGGITPAYGGNRM
jgi:hypothetical protein